MTEHRQDTSHCSRAQTRPTHPLKRLERDCHPLDLKTSHWVLVEFRCLGFSYSRIFIIEHRLQGFLPHNLHHTPTIGITCYYLPKCKAEPSVNGIILFSISISIIYYKKWEEDADYKLVIEILLLYVCFTTTEVFLWLIKESTLSI